jgi:serine/threonine protein kinase
VGKSSDIFALGALLYTMLTLSAPFSGKNNEEVLLKTLTEDPPKASKVAPRGTVISRELELVCRKAMAKDPAERYASVTDLRMAVMSFQTRVFQSSIFHRQRKHLVSGIILILFIFITLLVVYWKNFC